MHGYAPAPLDELSLWNGVCKFQHDQFLVSDKAIEFMLEVLDYYFPLMNKYSKVSSDKIVERELFEHKHKTAGYPWFIRGTPLKGNVHETFGLSAIEQYYQQYTSVIGSTLKDELRPVDKDSRLFRPQDVSSYVEGIRLFYYQNEYLMSTFGRSPLCNRFVLPGRDIPMIFTLLNEFSELCYGGDGSRWDANFPLILASVVATFRARHLPEDRVQRYYQMMYNGYTNVGGHLLHLVGQPSGHYNTSVDNSLANICLMALHAYNQGMDLEDFVNKVLFFVCGDDLIWADRSGLFAPELLSSSYVSAGVYLEFEHLEPHHAYDLGFVGQRISVRYVNGVRVKMTCLRYDRTVASAHIRRRSATAKDELAKLVSLVQLSFGDEELYNIINGVLQSFVATCLVDQRLSLADTEVVGLMRAVTPRALTQLHLGLEVNFSSNSCQT